LALTITKPSYKISTPGGRVVAKQIARHYKKPVDL
jgi:hypothetical protein